MQRMSSFLGEKTSRNRLEVVKGKPVKPHPRAPLMDFVFLDAFSGVETVAWFNDERAKASSGRAE